LARLKSIQSALNKILKLDDKGNIIQPASGSAEEKILIQLKKQYDAARISISNTINVDDRQNELLVKEEQLLNLDDSIIKCESERKAKGWGLPGGAISSYSGPSAVSTSNSSIDGMSVNSEQAIFCNLPVIGGYNHETFINKTGITHPEIPMINASKVLKYKITTIGSMLTFSKKTAYVNIKLNCNNIFNASLLDYKGDLPGLTNVREVIDPLPSDTGETGTCEFSDGIEEDVTREYCIDNDGRWTQNIIIDTPQNEVSL
jgi:hypothetical protein